MGFSGTRMSGFNWSFFLTRLEENSSPKEKEGGARTRTTSIFSGLYLTRFDHDTFKILNCEIWSFATEPVMMFKDPILVGNI